VFGGGWTLEAAETVCEEPMALDYLAQLRDCSLILIEDEEHEARFRMLETLREYASQRLDSGEREALERGHAEFYLTLAERAERELRGKQQSGWLERLWAEHDNLRAALDWGKAAGRNTDAALRLGFALWKFWYAQGHLSEGRKQLTAVLAMASQRTALMAKTLNAAGGLAFHQGDLASDRSFYQEGLAIGM